MTQTTTRMFTGTPPAYKMNALATISALSAVIGLAFVFLPRLFLSAESVDGLFGEHQIFFYTYAAAIFISQPLAILSGYVGMKHIWKNPQRPKVKVIVLALLGMLGGLVLFYYTWFLWLSLIMFGFSF